MIIRFHVGGRPRTKGSLKVISPRGRKPILAEDHAHSLPWRRAIKKAIMQQHPGVMFPGPVRMDVDFVFEQLGPTAAKLAWPTVNAGIYANGDIDKLTRNLLDAMQDAQLISDDCMVVGMNEIKRWAFAGEAPGIYVEVTNA